jgi:hypothetical protein
MTHFGEAIEPWRPSCGAQLCFVFSALQHLHLYHVHVIPGSVKKANTNYEPRITRSMSGRLCHHVKSEAFNQMLLS